MSVIIALTILVFNVRNQHMPAASAKIRLVFIPLHILTAVALFCGVTKELGAYCNNAQVIPWIFLAPPCILIIALLVYMNLYALDFLIEWEAPVDLAARKKFGSLERTIKIQKLFTSQTRRMYCHIGLTTSLTIILVAIGFIYVKKTGHVTCSSDGKSWLFADMQLSMWFYAAILFISLINSAVLRVAFIKQI